MRATSIRYGIGILLALISALGAFAQQYAEGEPQELVQRLLASSSDTKGVFEADGGKVRHVQSGLTCPAYVQNAFLSHLFVYDTPVGLGADVGCDYARRVGPGSKQAAAKHSVFAVKLPEGGTLDTAFATYQAEMHQTAPKDAKSGGESLHLKGMDDDFPKVRSEELFYAVDGKAYQTEVIVTVLKGWIIEIRSTRASQYALSNREEAIDQFSGADLFFRAVGDLGGPRIEPTFQVEPKINQSEKSAL